jgi:hypothetical protein
MGHGFVRAHPGVSRARYAGWVLALVLVLLSACTGQLPSVIPATPAPQTRAADTSITGTVVPAPALSASPDLLALPAAFRYEVTLRPMQADAPTTMITGQYRDGAWAQRSRTGDQPGDELVVVRDPATNRLNTYTRATGDAGWTKWPGVTFDAAYGLASPFTVLRLRPLATRSATTGSSAEPGATPDADVRDGEVKTQALFSTEVVQRVLTAGVLAAASSDETRAALEAQVAPFIVPQTVTYRTGSSDRVLAAAGTLLSLGPDNQPAPWVEFTASYSSYDDPAIVIAAPANATDIGAVAGSDAVAEQASDVQPGVNLRVRVFASAGVPATDSVVTAYPAGKKTAAAEKLGPDAQFALKPGTYDVLVKSGGAEQWLKGVAVAKNALASNDVLFDFAELTVTVKLNAAAVAVDVVVYPAGEKTSFAGFASNNPAKFRLPVGLYDVEVATQDGQAVKRVTDVAVRSGLETSLDMDLAPP